MGIDKLISIAAMLALVAAVAGQIPRTVILIHEAQRQLIRESRASVWGHPFLLPLPK